LFRAADLVFHPETTLLVLMPVYPQMQSSLTKRTLFR
jgi:hypothetical protein